MKEAEAPIGCNPSPFETASTLNVKLTSSEYLSNRMSDLQEVYEKITGYDERAIACVEFEWCQIVREAGRMYRDGEGIGKISNTIDIRDNDAREAMTVAQIIFNSPPEEVSARAYNTGYRFFVEKEDANSIASTDARSINEVKKEIREFVGTVYAARDVEGTELTAPPDEFEGESPRVKAASTLHENNVAEEIVEINKSVPSVDITAGIDLSPILSALSEYQEVANQKLEEAIQELEPPEEYDPQQVSIDTIAVDEGVRALERFIDELDAIHGEEIADLQGRLQRGYDAYQDEEYMLACFVFISVQDGLMTHLCTKREEMEPNDNGFFEIEKRIPSLKKCYNEVERDFNDLEWNNIEESVDHFVEHRNHIMHGNPKAFFDENIAIISLLFLVFTIFTVLTWSEEDQY